MASVKVGKYEYMKSSRPGKKLMVKVDNKLIHFGDINAEHYFDKSGLLDKKLNHMDAKRRENYRKRHSAIKLKNGKLAISNPNQPAWHSYNILW